MKYYKKILFILVFLLTSLHSNCQDSTWIKYVDHVGINPGIWFPEKNKIIGPQSLVGFSVGLKKKVHSLLIYADFIGLFSKTRDTLKISDNNVIINGTRMAGQQFTLSYGIDILRKGKFTTRLETGIGHSVLTINPKKEQLQKKYNFLVPGIHFKINLTKNTSLGLTVQYYVTRYMSPGTYPEIKGNYLSARIIFSFR